MLKYIGKKTYIMLIPVDSGNLISDLLGRA